MKKFRVILKFHDNLSISTKRQTLFHQNTRNCMYRIKQNCFKFSIPFYILWELTCPCPVAFKLNTSADIQYARHNQRRKWARIQTKQMRVALEPGNKEEKTGRETREFPRNTKDSIIPPRHVVCCPRSENLGNFFFLE